MKLSKGEAAVLLLAALFLAFSAGWFFRGRSGGAALRVETDRPAGTAQATQAAQLPEPSDREETALVDLNTAGVEELQTLPNIGEKRAASIVADREANGPYRYPEDLLRVPGIGAEILAGLLDYVTTGD